VSDPSFRIVVPFCDQWADPGPEGAVIDAIREALCAETGAMDPAQMPAWLVSRYIDAVDRGGHGGYLAGLHAGVAARVPPTVDALHLIGLSHAADILTRAFARLRAGGEDFGDLDNEYFILGMADPADHPQSVFDAYLGEHAALFVELAPPTPADRMLLDIGDPGLHRDRGRAAWLGLLDHGSARVRLKAAQNLLRWDREIALRVAHGIAGDHAANRWLREHAQRLLRVGGTPAEDR